MCFPRAAVPRKCDNPPQHKGRPSFERDGLLLGFFWGKGNPFRWRAKGFPFPPSPPSPPQTRFFQEDAPFRQRRRFPSTTVPRSLLALSHKKTAGVPATPKSPPGVFLARIFPRCNCLPAPLPPAGLPLLHCQMRPRPPPLAADAAMARARRRSRTPEGRTERRSRRGHRPAGTAGKVRADAPRDTRRTGYSQIKRRLSRYRKKGSTGVQGV